DNVHVARPTKTLGPHARQQERPQGPAKEHCLNIHFAQIAKSFYNRSAPLPIAAPTQSSNVLSELLLHPRYGGDSIHSSTRRAVASQRNRSCRTRDPLPAASDGTAPANLARP